MTQKTPREALENLRTHQQQLDQDGIMVGVSRQALDEVIAYCASLEGNQRTPGTVEVCSLCKSEFPCAKGLGCLMRGYSCPLKQVTK